MFCRRSSDVTSNQIRCRPAQDGPVATPRMTYRAIQILATNRSLTPQTVLRPEIWSLMFLDCLIRTAVYNVSPNIKKQRPKVTTAKSYAVEPLWRVRGQCQSILKTTSSSQLE